MNTTLSIKKIYVYATNESLPHLLENLRRHFIKQELIERNLTSIVYDENRFKIESQKPKEELIECNNPLSQEPQNYIVEITEEKFSETIPAHASISGRWSIYDGSWEEIYLKLAGNSNELIMTRWSQKIYIVKK